MGMTKGNSERPMDLSHRFARISTDQKNKQTGDYPRISAAIIHSLFTIDHLPFTRDDTSYHH